MPDASRRRTLPERFARFIPGVAWLADHFARVAAKRAGRVRVGLLALLPVAILIDVFDAADELVAGPVGVAIAFVVETAFVLGVTGRASWSLGGAAFDLIPGIDVVPVATITVLVELARDFRAPREHEDAERHTPTGPVIEV